MKMKINDNLKKKLTSDNVKGWGERAIVIKITLTRAENGVRWPNVEKMVRNRSPWYSSFTNPRRSMFFFLCEYEVQLSGCNSGTTCFTRIYWHVGSIDVC